MCCLFGGHPPFPRPPTSQPSIGSSWLRSLMTLWLAWKKTSRNLSSVTTRDVVCFYGRICRGTDVLHTPTDPLIYCNPQLLPLKNSVQVESPGVNMSRTFHFLFSFSFFFGFLWRQLKGGRRCFGSWFKSTQSLSAGKTWWQQLHDCGFYLFTCCWHRKQGQPWSKNKLYILKCVSQWSISFNRSLPSKGTRMSQNS